MASEADLNTELLIKRRVAAAFPRTASWARRPERRPGARAGTVGRRSDRRNATLHQRLVKLVRLDRFRVGQRAEVRHGLRAGARRAVRRRRRFPATLNGAPVERRSVAALTDGHHRRRLRAAHPDRAVPVDLAAVPRCGRDVLSRRVGRARALLRRLRPPDRLHRGPSQFLGLSRRARRRPRGGPRRPTTSLSTTDCMSAIR